ncbi:DMT family transporter [Vibrio sp. SCSIO 43137]|uniref:DMT family transporter n=1 Tax=Vibrio sp. SCSIO 43137 TaxID=3021011 RepID=UPI002308018F|nr:DMT family transporter [Vibrio sp. SCSIO 43137]WCE32280.1 DMT family transporter [Vibrio sp. SCSIO 43137]
MQSLNLNRYSLLALCGGGLLALMIYLNSQLAASTSAVNASWLAHGIGALVAYSLLAITRKTDTTGGERSKAPRIFFLGGVPGALTVVLASVTVNSAIGLSGTLALGLIGQLSFSLLCEHFGWLNLPKRAFTAMELLPVLLVTAGSTLIIFARS